MTMARVNLVKGFGPVLQIAEGVTCELPRDAHETLEKRTDPTWPTTWFAPKLTGRGAFTDVYTVMAKWGANHGALSYGHIGDRLITLASVLRIPVGMHNIEPSRVFHPTYWDHCGTDCPESADYRACAALGPLYG
jgi:L-fucose isomerase